jgi:hypothetical protein
MYVSTTLCECAETEGDMALPSGIYTIENVKNYNWAMLLNANEGEVVAGSSVSTNVGEKVSLLKM